MLTLISLILFLIKAEVMSTTSTNTDLQLKPCGWKMTAFCFLGFSPDEGTKTLIMLTLSIFKSDQFQLGIHSKAVYYVLYFHWQVLLERNLCTNQVGNSEEVYEGGERVELHLSHLVGSPLISHPSGNPWHLWHRFFSCISVSACLPSGHTEVW